jgi:hypothetical protein
MALGNKKGKEENQFNDKICSLSLVFFFFLILGLSNIKELGVAD